jgi:hypothetical protein
LVHGTSRQQVASGAVTSNDRPKVLVVPQVGARLPAPYMAQIEPKRRFGGPWPWVSVAASLAILAGWYALIAF